MPTWIAWRRAAWIAGICGIGACGRVDVYPDGFLPPCISSDECGATEVCVNNKCVAVPVRDMAMRPRDHALWPPDPPWPDLPTPDANMGCGCGQGTKCCVDHCIPSGWCCTSNDCQAAGETCQANGKCRCPQGQKRCGDICIPNADCCTGNDCPSKICREGLCTVPDCTDGYPNGDETDLDCGGKCPACLAGRYCGRAADCRSNSCVNLQCAEPGFSKAFYGGGNHPAFIRAGDFDHDGKPDLIALDSDGTAAVGSQNLSVLEGRGDGTFIATGSYATGLGPVHAAVADLNGDMRLDVVVANLASNDVSVLLGNGDGSFQPQVRYRAAGGPRWVAIGDPNRDGRPDIVVSNDTTSSFGLLLGNGNGTFKAQVQTVTWAQRPRAVVLEDFNNDGFDDVAVQQVGAPPRGTVGFNTGAISIYISKPGGGFQLPWSYATATTLLTSLFVQDLNGDAKADLVVGSASFTTPQIFNGTGAGTFQLAGALQSTYARSVEFVDLDGDKIVDLISGSGVHPGNGNGSFRQYVPYIGAGGAVQSLAAADYNRDGKLDIAWADPVNNNVHALLGRGDGTLGDPRADPRVFSDTDVTLVSPRAVRIADLDGDGRGDVLVGSGPTGPMSSANLLVYLANANGTLQAPSWYASAPATRRATSWSPRSPATRRPTWWWPMPPTATSITWRVRAGVSWRRPGRSPPAPPSPRSPPPTSTATARWTSWPPPAAPRCSTSWATTTAPSPRRRACPWAPRPSR